MNALSEVVGAPGIYIHMYLRPAERDVTQALNARRANLLFHSEKYMQFVQPYFVPWQT